MSCRVEGWRLERFERKFAKRIDGCWEWTAYKDADSGYGQFSIGPSKPAWAHRVSYETYIGPIPDGMQVDHLCRNRGCVNPAHLEAVPPRINMLRSMAPAAVVWRTNRCLRDHELTPENTYVRPDGAGRQCRECIRIRSARQTARRRAAREEAA